MPSQQSPPYITAESLASALMESHACDSVEEATAIAHTIMQDVHEKSNDTGDELEMNIIIVESLQDYFGLEPDEARDILRKAGANEGGDNDGHSESSAEEEDAIQDHTDTDSDNDGEMIGEGECELCERLVQLTKHHLIPKSTHPRIEPKLLHAATAIQEGEEEKARVILGPGLEHVVDALSVSLSDSSNNRIIVKRLLSKTCDICRPCHSAVHNTHDNMVLALQYNTVEQLLNDEAIYKFCQWAHKQKAGKYALMRK
jgi:hypothetical protein